MGSEPESRSRELARLVERTPELQEATIIADPDYLVEPLPNYLPNPTCLLRERRFGNTVRFTASARLTVYLQDVLDEARQVHGMTGKPVVILLQERVDPSAATTKATTSTCSTHGRSRPASLRRDGRRTLPHGTRYSLAPSLA